MHLALVLAATKTLWDPTIIGILAPVVGCLPLLRLRVPAALDQPRRAARLPRRGGRAHGLHGAAEHAVAHDEHAAREPEGPRRVVEGRRGRQVVRGLEDRGGAQHRPGRRAPASAAGDDDPFVPRQRVRAGEPRVRREAAGQPFAQFEQASDYITDDPKQDLQTYQVGGGSNYYFWHHPEYAAVQFCITLPVVVPFGQPPSAAEVRSRPAKKVAVLVYDFGSTRLPPVCYLFGSIILFILSMLGLHWYELDERERAKQAAAGPSPVPAT